MQAPSKDAPNHGHVTKLTAQAAGKAPNAGDPAAELQLVSFRKSGSSVFSGTPFCAKLELALRLAGIEFTGLAGNLLNSKHAPKRKVCLPGFLLTMSTTASLATCSPPNMHHSAMYMCVGLAPW